MVSMKVLKLNDNPDDCASRSRSIMMEYLTNSKLNFSDVVVMATDFLLAGIDTVNFLF